MERRFIKEYECNYALYQETMEKMRQALAQICKRNAFHIHQITGRIKEMSSLRRKIILAPHKYHTLSDITDVCGMRVITYYEDEVDAIAAALRGQFKIDELNCVDKRALLRAESFGYTSVHLILEIPLENQAEQLPMQCKIEVQICSILQHTWAEIEHDLLYKNKPAESYAARRCFSRLAGLLEIADLEFIKLRKAIHVDKPHDAKASFLNTYVRRFPALLPPAMKSQRFGHVSWTAFAASWFMVAAVLFSALATIHFSHQMLQIAAKLSLMLTDV